MEVNNDDLMKLIKERFSGLSQVEQDEIGQCVARMSIDIRLNIIYEVSNRMRFETLKPISKPAVYMKNFCDVIDDGDYPFTAYSSSHYSQKYNA